MSPPHNSLREARLLSLAAHTNTIPLLSTFHQPGGHFILVFPFMPHTLEDLLHQHTLTVTHIRFCLHNVFSALAHVHSLGIIHRDIKPSNILFASPSGPAYLADFGIAWMEGDAASEPADQKITDVGTTAYRPPELLFGNATYNTSLDIWAAGCVLAETLLRVRKTLFDPGPLGSDLALIKSIFETLGTPTIKNWPVISSTTLELIKYLLTPARKQQNIPIGARSSSMSIPPSHGRRSYLMQTRQEEIS